MDTEIKVGRLNLRCSILLPIYKIEYDLDNVQRTLTLLWYSVHIFLKCLVTENSIEAEMSIITDTQIIEIDWNAKMRNHLWLCEIFLYHSQDVLIFYLISKEAIMNNMLANVSFL